MRKKFFLAITWLMSMLLILGMSSVLNASAAFMPRNAQETNPTIASDYADYPPGATVNLTGTNWQGDTEVRIIVNDDVGQTWSRDVTVPVSEDGSVSDSFQLPSYFVARYVVVASGQQSGRVATTTFTDLSIGTYDQCSNDLGTGYTTGNTGCRWINGNLQSNNSRYFEGDATVQRLWLEEFVPGSTHTITLKYGTTKGGKHAYDFLTTWDWSEDWVTVADRCESITGCTTASESALDIPEDPNVPNSFEPSAPGDRQFVMRGGTLNNATTPSIVSGTYAGDSETVITINFTVGPSSGPLCPTSGPKAGTCGVVIWFGAHVASQANWGLGNGAGSISGSPYHVSLDAIDGGSIGQRDNQMQAGVVTSVPNGTIIIVKDAVPDDPQDFNFNLNNNSTISQDFSLDDDADGTLPNSQTFSVPPGIWTATELNIPAGWTLTNLVCVDPTNNTTVDVGTATATINLASSETVTCTYTNTKATPTDTPTNTPTNTPTDTPTNTPTNTPTDTPTNTPTDTPTNTPTDTPTNTPLPTATFTPTDTPTNTPLPTATHTPTDTPTNTPLPTATHTPTDTPTNTPLPTATHTPTDTPTNTPLPTDTPTNTPTDTPTNTPLPTATHTPTDTPTNTPLPTATHTPTDTPTNTPLPTATFTPTDTPTNTPLPTDTPTNTPAANLGQLKVCKVAGAGVQEGTLFTINVNNVPYSVPAGKENGYCVLAGQFALNTQVTVQENIPAGYFVARIEVKPSGRQVSKNVSLGKVIVKIGTGVTEVIFTNKASVTPTATPQFTATPKPTRTPLGCSPNCTPTATPVPTGRLQICKEAGGDGVSGYFTFKFAGKSRTIPVGACTSLITVPVGSLTITEVARTGYVVTDIYTIPADRLVSENLSTRSATVTIVQGNASTQTIVIFRNEVGSTQTRTDQVSNTYVSATSPNAPSSFWDNLWRAILGTDPKVSLSLVNQ